MKIWGILLSLLIATTSFAAAPPVVPAERLHFQILLGPDFRYERDGDQQLVFRTLLNAGFGLRYDRISAMLEAASFNSQSGNSTLAIQRGHLEYMLWGNYNFMQFGDWNFFGAVGFGAYQENVKTTLGASSSTDVGGYQPMGGAGAGIKALLWRWLLLSGELRLIAGQNLDPNPQFSIQLLRLGVEF
jgi:hypothetical protein